MASIPSPDLQTTMPKPLESVGFLGAFAALRELLPARRRASRPESGYVVPREVAKPPRTQRWPTQVWNCLHGEHPVSGLADDNAKTLESVGFLGASAALRDPLPARRRASRLESGYVVPREIAKPPRTQRWPTQVWNCLHGEHPVSGLADDNAETLRVGWFSWRLCGFARTSSCPTTPGVRRCSLARSRQERNAGAGMELPSWRAFLA